MMFISFSPLAAFRQYHSAVKSLDLLRGKILRL
jgi:hypothetical protein